jgi:hypothetical protein
MKMILACKQENPRTPETNTIASQCHAPKQAQCEPQFRIVYMPRHGEEERVEEKKREIKKTRLSSMQRRSLNPPFRATQERTRFITYPVSHILWPWPLASLPLP